MMINRESVPRTLDYGQIQTVKLKCECRLQRSLRFTSVTTGGHSIPTNHSRISCSSQWDFNITTYTLPVITFWRSIPELWGHFTDLPNHHWSNIKNELNTTYEVAASSEFLQSFSQKCILTKMWSTWTILQQILRSNLLIRQEQYFCEKSCTWRY